MSDWKDPESIGRLLTGIGAAAPTITKLAERLQKLLEKKSADPDVLGVLEQIVAQMGRMSDTMGRQIKILEHVVSASKTQQDRLDDLTQRLTALEQGEARRTDREKQEPTPKPSEVTAP